MRSSGGYGLEKACWTGLVDFIVSKIPVFSFGPCGLIRDGRSGRCGMAKICTRAQRIN